jgi:hypothetical protein
LIHTTRPSYWAACTSTDVPFSTAWSIISSQVKSSGGGSTRSLRYQSSWVLLVCGIAQIWSSKRAVSSGPSSLPSSAALRRSPSQGRIHSAWANSAVQITSSDARSMSSSSAARRRTSSSRCWSAMFGSFT